MPEAPARFPPVSTRRAPCTSHCSLSTRIGEGMATFDPYAPQETKFRREFLIRAALLAIPLAAVLISSPDIDLSISSVVREACPIQSAPGRPWCATWTVGLARQFFMVLFLLVAIATLVATVRVLVTKRRWLGSEQ